MNCIKYTSLFFVFNLSAGRPLCIDQEEKTALSITPPPCLTVQDFLTMEFHSVGFGTALLIQETPELHPQTEPIDDGTPVEPLELEPASTTSEYIER